MRLFFHHIGQKTGVQHLAMTVYRDVPIAVAETAIPEIDPLREQILTDLSRKFPSGSFDAWGVPEPGASVVQRLRVGDVVLLIERVSEFGEVPILCLVEVYHHHQLPALSEALWGSGHYPYIFFFRTQEISLGWREMLGHFDYGERFNPRGTFGSVASERLDAFGGVAGYVQHLLGKSESKITMFGPTTASDFATIEEDEVPYILDINRELSALQEKLGYEPELVEGLGLQEKTVLSRARSAAFRLAVRRAYGERCAICGGDIRGPNGEPEVQSAHIYPKELDGSDDIRNGLCLCRRHHWALDVGWMTIADDYTIVIRDDLPQDPQYDFIREYSGKRILTPVESRLAPATLFIGEHRVLKGFKNS
ncbi:MAG: HNH endonuclease [Chloroflexia bacterium]|nr:HNH endonuclease [Chloroflexia bacterium]